MARRDEAIIKAAVKQHRPAALVCVNLQNFKAFNVLLGHQRGDQFLVGVEQQLGEIGRTWRTGGDEFVALVGGTLAAITDQVRAFSWLFHTKIGATEAWSFRFTDGRKSPPVPWRSFEVVCTPRCGIAELRTSAGESLRLARSRCGDLRTAGELQEGFAPLIRGPWTNEKRLATLSCPDCGQAGPTALEVDLGWSRERCSHCDASYERINVLSVLGELAEAGYM